MDMYVRMVDDLQRGPDDNPTVGIILCAGKDTSVVRYSVLHENDNFLPANTNWYCRPKTNSGQSWKRNNCGWQNKKK